MEIHPNFTFGGSKHVKNNVETMVERSFHVLVMALLLRYSALSGGGLLDDLRGGGMQGRQDRFCLVVDVAVVVTEGNGSCLTLFHIFFNIERCHSF